MKIRWRATEPSGASSSVERGRRGQPQCLESTELKHYISKRNGAGSGGNASRHATVENASFLIYNTIPRVYILYSYSVIVFRIGHERMKLG
jgi:hypothetical protein